MLLITVIRSELLDRYTPEFPLVMNVFCTTITSTAPGYSWMPWPRLCSKTFSATRLPPPFVLLQ